MQKEITINVLIVRDKTQTGPVRVVCLCGGLGHLKVKVIPDCHLQGGVYQQLLGYLSDSIVCFFFKSGPTLSFHSYLNSTRIEPRIVCDIQI